MADLISMMSAAAGLGGEYEISRSLRFNSADSAYLNRTPATAGNRKTWTYSVWLKRSGTAESGRLLSDTANSAFIRWGTDNAGANNAIYWRFSSGPTYVESSASFRDFSAWYHFIFAADTTQATASDRLKIYVNGTQIAIAFSSYPTLNADGPISNNTEHQIGLLLNGSFPSGVDKFDGYLTEINFIDGQALDPTSFGEFNSDTGVWQPIEYTGTYGTNGFYLNFSDNTSTTTLGEDQAGSNDWTTNNFSVTAGAGNDSLVDSPTRYGTDTGAGGEVRGNYATLNPLDKGSAANPVSQNGNLDLVGADSSFDGIRSTFGITSSKWYWEVTIAAEGNETRTGPGIYAPTNNLAGDYGNGTLVVFDYLGTIYISDESGGSSSIYFSVAGTISAGDIFGFAFDADSGKVWVSKNGSYYNSGVPASGTGQVATLTTGITYFPGGWAYNSSDKLEFNFGQRAYSYTAPSGFKALVTTNLPTPTIEDGGDYFNAILYTGTGSTNVQTGVGFQPDLVWIKERNAAADHALYDAVRGVQNQLESNTTTAETAEANGLTAFGTDGFTVGSLAQVNTNTDTYVAWNWKANGAGVSNTAGTITSTVSVNTTSGFSIVTYTGTGSAATVGHGLGAVPRMIIVKNRDQADAWQVYHAANTANPETDYLVLNTTAATADNADRWNDTLPTSTVFSIGNGVEVNTNTEDYVAYCFAEVPGFSSLGSYVGNGSADGPFVYTGFRPKFIMRKQTTDNGDVGGWVMFDTSRDLFNVATKRLLAQSSNAEVTPGNDIDILSNGWKERSSDGYTNASGQTFIYMAFAENPFAYSLAR
jgi:hypothetical protein